MKHRPLRVAQQIQRVLAVTMQKSFSPSELWQITITRVTVTSDLRLAKVYYTSFQKGEEAPKQAADALSAHEPALKRALAKKLRLRYQPELRFIWDEELETAQRVETILDEIKKEN